MNGGSARRSLLAGIVATLATRAFGHEHKATPASPGARDPLATQFGGPFALTDHTGKRVTDADFRGRFMLVYFGFTRCAETCPVDLPVIAQALDGLGPLAAKIAPLFISVDPERDTPQQLALYLQSFDKRIVGLTGTVEQVDAAVRVFKAYAKKVPTDAGYTMDHSSSVYVMDAKGGFRTIIDYHEEEQPALAKIRMVLR